MAVQCDRLDALTLLMRISGLVTDATPQQALERIFDHSPLGYLIVDITETMYAQVDETYLISVVHRLIDQAEISSASYIALSTRPRFRRSSLFCRPSLITEKC